MATINFVGGEIGGAGKSTFCMLLIEAFTLYEIPYHFRDTDRTTPNVGWAYDAEHYIKGVTNNTLKGNFIDDDDDDSDEQKWKPVIFSEDYDDFAKADTLIDLAGERDVIVNLPAQVSSSFDKWLNAGDFLKCQDELGIKFVYWWVAKAERRSLDLFYQNIQRFPSMPHILVRNQVRGVGEKWHSILRQEQLDDLHRRGVTIMDLPELQLAPNERGILDRDNPRFGDLASPADKRLGTSSRMRCRKFVDTTLNNIVATGYLDGVGQTEESQAKSEDVNENQVDANDNQLDEKDNQVDANDDLATPQVEQNEEQQTESKLEEQSESPSEEKSEEQSEQNPEEKTEATVAA